VFVGLQRFSNLDGSRLKWWINAFASTIAAKVLLIALTPLAQQVDLQPTTSATRAPEQQLGSPEQQLSDIVADINKTTPQQANSVSRLDSAEVAPGLVLQYNYTLTTIPGDEDEMAAARLKLQSIREGALQYFCTSPAGAAVRKFGGTTRYLFSNENGQPIGAFKLSDSDCSTPAQSR
jgi:hypothetical protein